MSTMIEQKKRKLSSAIVAARRDPSKIFSPYRVIGNVSNYVPFSVGTLGSTFYIVTSVGKSFQIYDANNLHLLFVSEKELDNPITAFATHFHYVYVGSGNKVFVFKRGIQEYEIELKANARVKSVCVFGDFLCASAEDGILYIYKKKNASAKYPTEYYSQFQVTELLGGDIVSIIHLPTYLNKIVIITKSNLLLINVRTGKLLFQSQEFPNNITTACDAPALDIIALGTNAGQLMMYNIKKGKVIRNINIPKSHISSISFRTDGAPHMSVGCTNGDLIFYDLDRRSRIHVIKNAHKESLGGVMKAMFLNGQPIIVTSGGDNSLKEFVFDPSLSQADGETVVQPPRLLRSRGGHSQPPSCIQFADSSAHMLLSSSRDRSLWSFSLRKDAQSQELSQRLHKNSNGDRLAGGSVREKFPEILSMAIENSRLGEWENVITAHKDEKSARTWDMRNKRVGRWTFNTTDDGFAKSVALSQCGNFGLVGSSNGSIVVYNMQSGLIRRKYKLHKKAVTGIAIDGMNRKMVSCGLDGIVGFYDFNKATLLGKLVLDSSISSMVYHRSSDLIALVLDDLSIVVIDTITQKIVRQLWGHSNRITSLDFSPDGRWIVSTSLDSTLRTWDLPTGNCIDGVKLENVATNIQFSANGEFIATSHVVGNGICLWTNKSQFKSISTRAISEDEFRNIMLPNNSASGNSNIIEGALDVSNDDELDIDFTNYESLSQINEDLITLSVGPRNKLNTLLNLDIIKQRSKPTEAPKKPEKASFFLQLTGDKIGDEASTREGVVDTSALESAESESKLNEAGAAEQELQKFKPRGHVELESQFTKLLRECSKQNNYSKFLEYLIKLSPSLIDIEIRGLDSFEPFNEIIFFINALTSGLKSKRNFELYEAFMSILFKVHGDVLHSNNTNANISEALEKWDIVHSECNKLDDLLKYCSGVLNFISSN
ncbi:hypothetical protein TPHA_0B02080 [Tetrapisispora phaffii CBS 4417]|uniref:Uncharacterized protein n=1 Tax=Tetrapisispora phaffii (strain ATCC 24235 / CBS 4417 / NBRC 1672 / NRRL Y-8282 / UCD 70-5) TaxID=1071381 RepID=G8BPE9_TETPH|nr:hypothetical protein TPHA_0B02080 [Tetrapisispora phaffii CBS 4417]CCE61880.1 hypothetical protein TPHA_0B02080 [Tetrapisispora phaffii CBS 4417]